MRSIEVHTFAAARGYDRGYARYPHSSSGLHNQRLNHANAIPALAPATCISPAAEAISQMRAIGGYISCTTASGKLLLHKTSLHDVGSARVDVRLYFRAQDVEVGTPLVL